MRPTPPSGTHLMTQSKNNNGTLTDQARVTVSMFQQTLAYPQAFCRWTLVEEEEEEEEEEETEHTLQPLLQSRVRGAECLSEEEDEEEEGRLPLHLPDLLHPRWLGTGHVEELRRAMASLDRRVMLIHPLQCYPRLPSKQPRPHI
ncbi:unnamed protein product [Gadus morhua 'NCC']